MTTINLRYGGTAPGPDGSLGYYVERRTQVKPGVMLDEIQRIAPEAPTGYPVLWTDEDCARLDAALQKAYGS